VTPSMLYVRAGESRVLENTSDPVKLTTDDTLGAYALWEERVPPGVGPAARPAQESSLTYYVLQGRVAYRWQGAGAVFAAAGDVIHLPQAEACTYEGVGEEPCVLLALLAPADTSRRFRHIKAGEGRSLHVITDIGTFKLTREDTAGAYLLMEWRVPPQAGVAMHAQAGIETFYIVEGSFSFRGQRSSEHYTLLAERGDVIHVAERVPHSYKNIGNDPGRMLVWMAPAGRAQQFFEEIGSPVEDASAFPAAPALPDPAALRATLQKYQVDFF
jgi:quercetin dioxygenase-like cupin family protein